MTGAYDRCLAETLPVARAHALEVDRDARFPEEAVSALRSTGLLGLNSPSESGGMGAGLGAAVTVIRALAAECSSTAMVLMMHYAAAAVIGPYGQPEARKKVALGQCLATVAFSEFGSGSEFWVPVSTAGAVPGGARLDARKSWVTSGAQADLYVWSSRPVEAEGLMTLWLVGSGSPGLEVSGGFDGLGLRGNGSVPISAKGVFVERSAMLGEDGAGLDVAMVTMLPWFLVLNAAFSVGLCEAVTDETRGHLTGRRLAHLDISLAGQPIPRADLARMRIATDSASALLSETVTAWEKGRPEALLRVLEVKAAASEAALAVTETAMKVCGGSAFRKELGVERRFRDARAARVMAPTTDALYDFVGRSLCGMPLLGG